MAIGEGLEPPTVLPATVFKTAPSSSRIPTKYHSVKTIEYFYIYKRFLVGDMGLEPTRRVTPEPKSGASAIPPIPHIFAELNLFYLPWQHPVYTRIARSRDV